MVRNELLLTCILCSQSAYCNFATIFVAHHLEAGRRTIVAFPITSYTQKGQKEAAQMLEASKAIVVDTLKIQN
jgi:hypothetical protein